MKYFLLLVGLSFVAHAQQDLEHSWHPVKSKWGVEVSTRLNTNGYKFVKATTKVQGNPQDFLNLLDNTEIGPAWIANCEKVEILDSEGESMRVVHTYFKAPWPVKDRDMVTKSKTEIDELTGNITINVENYGEIAQQEDNYVRMESVQGQWKLTIISNSEYSLSYEGYGEPAGNIPLWLANRLLISSTFETFIGIKKQLNKEVSRTH